MRCCFTARNNLVAVQADPSKFHVEQMHFPTTIFACDYMIPGYSKLRKAIRSLAQPEFSANLHVMCCDA